MNLETPHDIAYPAETHRWLSWSAIQFINRPSPRALFWTAHGFGAILAAAIAAAFFVSVDQRVEPLGEIAADPGTLSVVSRLDEVLGLRLTRPGDPVARGQAIAELRMDVDSGVVERMLASLDRNEELIAASGRRRPLSSEVEDGSALAGAREASLRESAASLQTALRRLRDGLSDGGSFRTEKLDAMRQSRQLRGALAEYRERRVLRAPEDGTLIQFEASPGENVANGRTLALILPRGAVLSAKLRVEAKDLPRVVAGQRVLHRVEAYPYQRYGLFEGRVLRVERETGQNGEIHYDVWSSIAAPKSTEANLIIGMKLDSQILTGRRRLIDVIVDALVGSAIRQ